MRRPSAARGSMLGCAALVLLTAAAYLPVAGGGFIWDDDLMVTRNALVRGPDGLSAIWFEPSATLQYYPLAFTSFWLEHRLWGLWAPGYHLVNIAFHGLNAALLYLALRRLGAPLAWLTAAVFAVHPVHVESAGWVSELKNVQSGFFYLLAGLAYLHAVPIADSGGAPSRRIALYLASLVAFSCALLSKTVACTLPVALLLLAWWKTGRLTLASVLPTVPFWLIGLGPGLATVWMERHHVGAMGPEWALSPVDRCLVAGRALWFYARSLVWPAGLTFSYPRWRIDPTVWWQWMFPLSAIAAVAALLALRRRIGRGPLVGALYFIATLGPALGFVNVYPMRYSFVADHFQYLASIGLLTLGVAMATAAARRAGLARGLVGRVLAGATVVALVVPTWRRAGTFASAEVLWRDTLRKNPASWMAHDNLAVLLLDENRLAESEAEFEEELRLRPPSAEVLTNLGNIRARQGRLAEAGDYFARAVALDDAYAAAHNNLGNVLVMEGRLDEGARHYERALEINPTYADARANLVAVRQMTADRDR